MDTSSTPPATPGQSATTAFRTAPAHRTEAKFETESEAAEYNAISTFETTAPAPPRTNGAYPNPSPASNPPAVRALYGDLATGELYGELPLVGPVNWSRVLNDAGGASLAIPLSFNIDPRFQWRQAVVWIEDDGLIVKGIIATALTGVDLRADRANLIGPGVYSYMSSDHITQTVTHTGTTADIARRLLESPARAIRLQLSRPNDSNATVTTRRIDGHKFEPVAKAVADLADEANGFDFIDTYHRDQTGPIAVWQPVRKNGQIRSTVFEIGANVEHVSGEIDGSAMIDTALAIGSSNDTDTPSALVSAGRPGVPYTGRSSHTDVTDPTILRARGELELARGAQPITRPKVQLHPGAFPPGSHELGDIIELRGGHGLYQPAGRYRIIQESTTATTGQTLTTATLAPEALYE